MSESEIGRPRLYVEGRRAQAKMTAEQWNAVDQVRAYLKALGMPHAESDAIRYIVDCFADPRHPHMRAIIERRERP